jgi:hypothetical protein
MTLPIRLRGVAQVEYDDAADWYEARRRGLGLRFVGAVQQVLDTISTQPDRYPEVLPGIREAPVFEVAVLRLLPSPFRSCDGPGGLS